MSGTGQAPIVREEGREEGREGGREAKGAAEGTRGGPEIPVARHGTEQNFEGASRALHNYPGIAYRCIPIIRH